MAVEEIRKLASKSRGPTTGDTVVIDLRDEYAELHDAIEEYSNATIDVEELRSAVEKLDGLASLGTSIVSVEQAAEAWEAFSTVELLLGEDATGSADAFIEAWDEVEQLHDAYQDLKEQDRYDGKADDVAGAWDELSTALFALADAVEGLGLN